MATALNPGSTLPVAETFSPDTENRKRANKLEIRLKFAFTVLTCLGGLVLASGTQSETISVIAIFFACFGFLFVDWLKLFALPPVAAYAAMGLAALICIADFVEMQEAGNQQIIAVAQMLVYVQAILMLQLKNRRIFEQLGVFCLLELVVAAVFNNALNYAMLLVPICFVAIWALTLLAVLAVCEGIDNAELLSSEDPLLEGRKEQGRRNIHVRSSMSASSMLTIGNRMPRTTFFTLAPAMMLVATFFFYTIPRTIESTRTNSAGQAVVGFSDEVRMEQLGQMGQSTQVAARIALTEESSKRDYQPVDGVYLRGAVLENYRQQTFGKQSTSVWSSVSGATVASPTRIPIRLQSVTDSEQQDYDAVSAAVTVESSRTNSLFSIAPYFSQQNNSEVVHQSDRWVLARVSDLGWGYYPRLKYRFSTNAFRGGIQSEWIAADNGTNISSETSRRGAIRESTNDQDVEEEPSYKDIRRRNAVLSRQAAYRKEMLDFDAAAMPTIEKIAREQSIQPDGSRRSPVELAKALELYFNQANGFSYTLNLDAEKVAGLDTIEQFVSVDRKGHCQYFASALAMMLRSQRIPTRLVVGYHTEEYNEISDHYVARQCHAHAWVEALIDKDDIDPSLNLYGQPQSRRYWLRLDPTPGLGRPTDQAGGVGQVVDLAQSMWDEYVVDMDGERQEDAISGAVGGAAVRQSYSQFVDRLGLMVGWIRAGELGGGSLAGRNLFSWTGAAIAVALATGLIILVRLGPPTWIRSRLKRSIESRVSMPSVPFYLEVLKQLSRVGMSRQASQTPKELASVASQELQHPLVPEINKPLSILTQAFYQARFGTTESKDQDQVLDKQQVDQALQQLAQSVDLLTMQSGSKSSAVKEKIR